MAAFNAALAAFFLAAATHFPDGSGPSSLCWALSGAAAVLAFLDFME